MIPVDLEETQEIARTSFVDLEATQDLGVVNIFGGPLAPGVFRVIRDDQSPDPEYVTLQRAPELSEGIK